MCQAWRWRLASALRVSGDRAGIFKRLWRHFSKRAMNGHESVTEKAARRRLCGHYTAGSAT
jgi:hypothetical protein